MSRPPRHLVPTPPHLARPGGRIPHAGAVFWACLRTTSEFEPIVSDGDRVPEWLICSTVAANRQVSRPGAPSAPACGVGMGNDLGARDGLHVDGHADVIARRAL